MQKDKLKKMKSEILFLEYLTLNNSDIMENLDNLITKKKEYGKALEEYLDD